ncbi:MAG: hypothetical protein U0974_15745 [Gemmatimonadales bacterium]|nr:hypothetical protein [Gemmatimonadales bacterium]
MSRSREHQVIHTTACPVCGAAVGARCRPLSAGDQIIVDQRRLFVHGDRRQRWQQRRISDPRVPDALRTLDAYLTGKADATWPGAIVWRLGEDGHDGTAARYLLERRGQPEIPLGAAGFADARRALAALRKGVEPG